MLNRILPWFIVITLVVFIHFVDPSLFSRVWMLIQTGNIETIASYMRSFGIWTVAVSLLINIIINLSGILPTVLISGANGIVFGLGYGIVISWIGECLGTIIAFFLWRSLLRESAKRLIKKSVYLSTIDEFSGKNGFKAMLAARLVPLAPSGIITLVGALSSISFSDMLWATLLGKLPSIALEVLVGRNFAFAQDNKMRFLILLAVAVAYGFFVWRKRANPPTDSE